MTTKVSGNGTVLYSVKFLRFAVVFRRLVHEILSYLFNRNSRDILIGLQRCVANNQFSEATHKSLSFVTKIIISSP